MKESREELEASIEAVLEARFPEVELVDLEVRGSPAATLTLFIDRPGGVDLDLCVAVTQALDDLRERFALEVSSPGLNRRLRKPAHFVAALGKDVMVKTSSALGGRRSFRGILAEAGPDSITLQLDGGEHVTLPLSAVAKANVMYDFTKDGGHRE